MSEHRWLACDVPPDARALNRISVLWCLGGAKDVECVLYEDSRGFALTVERGEERERFWTFSAATAHDVVSVSRALRHRLTKSGWTLRHARGEQELESLIPPERIRGGLPPYPPRHG